MKTNKLWLAALFSLMVMTLSVFFASCEMEPKDNVIPDGVDANGIRYDGIYPPKSMRPPENIILHSIEQRDAYVNLVAEGYIEEDHYYKEAWELNGLSIMGLDKYTEEFFDTFNLVIIPTGGGNSMTSRQNVEKISIINNSLYIRIKRRIPKRLEMAAVLDKFQKCCIIHMKQDKTEAGAWK